MRDYTTYFGDFHFVQQKQVAEAPHSAVTVQLRLFAGWSRACVSCLHRETTSLEKLQQKIFSLPNRPTQISKLPLVVVTAM